MKSINYKELVTKVLNSNRGTALNIPVLELQMNWFSLLFMAGEWGYVVLKPRFAVNLERLIKTYASLKSVGLYYTKDVVTDDVLIHVQDNHIKDLAKLLADADAGKRLEPPKGSPEYHMLRGIPESAATPVDPSGSDVNF